MSNTTTAAPVFRPPLPLNDGGIVYVLLVNITIASISFIVFSIYRWYSQRRLYNNTKDFQAKGWFPHIGVTDNNSYTFTAPLLYNSDSSEGENDLEDLRSTCIKIIIVCCLSLNHHCRILNPTWTGAVSWLGVAHAENGTGRPCRKMRLRRHVVPYVPESNDPAMDCLLFLWPIDLAANQHHKQTSRWFPRYYHRQCCWSIAILGSHIYRFPLLFLDLWPCLQIPLFPHQ